MTPRTSDQQKTRQTNLRIALAVIFLISFGIRLLVPGVMLFIHGIVLIVISFVHWIVHLRAIKRVPFTAARYHTMIWCSHILFFLGFAFQIDGPDAAYGRVPILFWILLSSADGVVPIFNIVSTGSFILLSVSWLLLESVPLPRKRSASS
jgi:hypothetical protein